MPLQHSVIVWRDRLAKSRIFTISLAFHLILLAVFGTKAVIDLPTEPPEIQALVARSDPEPSRPPEKMEVPDLSLPPSSAPLNPLPMPDVIPTPRDTGPALLPPVHMPAPTQTGLVEHRPTVPISADLTLEDRQRLEKFTKWTPDGSASINRPITQRKFAFTAFIGRYRMGNWDSTVRLRDGKITGGSLPNLLYAMSKWSKDKVDTNERDVRAISLDSEELMTERPPFIFLAGTRDFRLTDQEVENLRNYICSGGAVWGDSSVPGQRSAFDHAFRREMQRVIRGDAAQFEALPGDHPIFTAGYYPSIKGQPAGVNHYREPVDVLRWRGEIAVLHTRNDYGDMWQIGLDRNARIDTSRNARGEYVAMDPSLWAQRGIYVRNIEQPAVEQAYRFGINVVIHLLTRWETRLASAPSL